MIVERTDLIRAQVTQEARVILPPCGQRVEYDPTAPRAQLTSEEVELLEATQHDPERLVEAAGFGRMTFRGQVLPFVREVQILLPPSPTLYVGLDIDPVELGINRGNYKLPPLASGVPIKLKLMPEQWITATVETGLVLLGLIVEYHPMPEGS